MAAGAVGLSRREQRREQTLQEIKGLAMEQIAAGGPEAVSLNGIARTMAMSPAAIYRYFENRDALLADLVVEYYDSLADATAAAAGTADEPAQRLSAVAYACRGWALEHPNAYRLIFQTTSGSGQDLAPERTVPAASRTMNTLLGALLPLAAEPATDVDAASALDGQLRAWAARTAMPQTPEPVLALGLLCWTRLHGVISLELGHHLASTGIDPALLFDLEVRTLIDQARHPRRTPSDRSRPGGPVR